jgi:hypothetical protein
MKSAAAIISIVAIVLACLIYADTGTILHNQYDDSYITYRYAANLAEHGALEYNLGERVDAASSFLYTVMLAAFYRVGFKDMAGISGMLNLLALGLIAGYVFMSVAKIYRPLVKYRWISEPGSCSYINNESEGYRTIYYIVPAILSLAASLHGFVSGWAVLSMDTVPFAALLVMYAYYQFINPGYTASLILACAIILMRPEGILIVPVWWFANRSEARGSLVLLGVFSALWTFKMTYYGFNLPNSFTAKLAIPYYKPDPMYTVKTWGMYAVVPVILAVSAAGKYLWGKCHA